jgi:hypothetical protein
MAATAALAAVRACRVSAPVMWPRPCHRPQQGGGSAGRCDVTVERGDEMPRARGALSTEGAMT